MDIYILFTCNRFMFTIHFTAKLLDLSNFEYIFTLCSLHWCADQLAVCTANMPLIYDTTWVMC